MIGTFVLYLGVLCIIYMLSCEAEKTGDRKYIYLIILTLSVLCGLRGYSVGKDTNDYVRFFRMIEAGNYSQVWGVEQGFKILILAVTKMTSNPTVLFLIISFITNLLIVNRLWSYKDLARFKVSCIVYYVLFYFYQFNLCRQMLAVAIVFWGSQYISKRNYIKFIICVLIASTFHTSALISMSMLVVEMLNWRYLNKKQKNIISLGMLISPVCIYFVYEYMDKYLKYFENMKLNFGPVILFKIMFLVISSIGLKQSIIFSKKPGIKLLYQNNQGDVSYKYDQVVYFYFLGLLLAALGYMFLFADRISLYFYLYECIYMGIVKKHKKHGKGYDLVMFILYLYLFIAMFISEGQGVVPYVLV